MVKPLDGAGELLGEGDAALGRVGREHVALGGFLERRGDAGALASGRVFGRVCGVEVGEALGELERGLEAVGEARLDTFANDDAVDDDFDVVLVFLVERGGAFDVVEDAVDADPGEARLLPFGELLAVLALAAADDRREQIVAASLRAIASPGRPSG